MSLSILKSAIQIECIIIIIIIILSGDMLKEATATTNISRLTTLDFVPEGTQQHLHILKASALSIVDMATC